MAQDLEPSLLETVPSPPRLAELILSRVVSKENEDVILGDFSEAFLDQVSMHGESAATIWYWMELAKSVPSLLQQHKASSLMTNKIIIAAGLSAGLIVNYFVLGNLFNETSIYWNAGSSLGMGLISGLLFSVVGIVANGFRLQPNDHKEYSKLLNTLKGLINVTIIIGSISLFLILIYILAAIGQSGGHPNISKLTRAISETGWCLLVGLSIAAFAKIAFHVFKDKEIQSRAK
jgi:hypothetical protein